MRRKVALVCRVDQAVTEKRENRDDQVCLGLKVNVVTRVRLEAVVRTADQE